MTDNEYGNLDNLTKIRTLLTLLRDITPDDEIIKKEDKNTVENQFVEWRDNLAKKIKIK